MNLLSQHLLFFFSLLGSFNGIALACFLWWRARGRPTQRWLALLVWLVSVRTGKSVAYHFWPEVSRTVQQVGLSAWFLIGPCLFFLLRSGLGPSAGLQRVDRWHLGLLIALTLALNLLLPYAQHVRIWWTWVIPGVNAGLLAYWLLATLVLWRRRAQLSDAQSALPLLGAWAGVGLIWVAYWTSTYTSYIVGALSFTFVLAFSLLIAWRVYSGQAAIEPYQDKRIPPDEARAYLTQLDALMAGEALYRDPTLSLQRLARRMGLPQAKLSQLLNDNNQTSFKQYLSQWRVDAAKALLRDAQPRSMEEVAEAAGFQSASTFYNAFKKLEGVTPAAYRKAVQSS
ncbi:MAG: helix-turn-helix domain-containing protein [Roseateles asaccharophilus]